MTEDSFWKINCPCRDDGPWLMSAPLQHFTPGKEIGIYLCARCGKEMDITPA